MIGSCPQVVTSKIEITKAGRAHPTEPTIANGYPDKVPSAPASLLSPSEITVTGELNEVLTIEVADTSDGPWSVWRTVVIGEEGTTEVDLDEGAEKRFNRVRD